MGLVPFETVVQGTQGYFPIMPKSLICFVFSAFEWNMVMQGSLPSHPGASVFEQFPFLEFMLSILYSTL